MAGEVVGVLQMPIPEHLGEQRRRNRGLDPVGEPGVAGLGHVETVLVAPLPHQRRRHRAPAVAYQDVNEAGRRVVLAAIVLRDPSQATGETEHRAPVGQ